MTEVTDDPYRWLEDLDDEAATAWVRDRNAETTAALAGGARFAELRDAFLEVLDSIERIPLPMSRGEYLYNFWKDAAHPRGLWRRATLDEYRKREPGWEVLLDLDALAEAEGENWVWQGATVVRPGYDRALVKLSRGGADAAVVREFDLPARAFVAGGFALPEAKSDIGWIDADRVYVGTDFGPGSLTTSGYPRIVKEWRRGTPLSEAVVVFEGEARDVAVSARHDPTPGFERAIVARYPGFFSSEQYVRTAGGELVRLAVPDDAIVDAHREWLLIRLRSAWAGHPAGALLVTRLDAYLAGERDLTVLFEPDARTSLSYHAWTRNHLILVMLSDVKSRLEVLTPPPPGAGVPPSAGGAFSGEGTPSGAGASSSVGGASSGAGASSSVGGASSGAGTSSSGGGGWSRAPLPGVPEFGNTEVVDTNLDHTDEYMLTSSGFIEPPTLRYGRVGVGVESLRQEPEFFDPAGMAVRQHFATSADGTRVPYFVVSPPGAAGPALLSGYGGFEVSRTPVYSGVLGRGWLARGGTYVVANIRGGGEYGPAWHEAAMREHRPRAYEDFAAVATDLVDRGVTSPERLGVEGGSNGGLLTGVMLTRYPELFGAVVSQVPLMDMRRYHELLAGASWMAEYGDPDDESDWEFLRSYSPYHNVRPGRPYPPVLLVTSTRDDRVHPAHARKMVARLREYGYDVTYYENIEGGHGAAADNAQLAFKWALVLEFLWRRLAP